MNEDSIFTKIIKGEIPCSKVYEDEHTLAFVDMQPIQFGQVVVVPKVQVPTIWDLPAGDYQALMATVQKVGQRMRDVYTHKQFIGVNIEGLGVRNHAHVKVYPFDDGPEYHHDPANDPHLTPEAMNEIAAQLYIHD